MRQGLMAITLQCVCVALLARSCIGVSLAHNLMRLTRKITSLNDHTTLTSVQKNTGEPCSSDLDCVGSRSCTSNVCINTSYFYCTDSSDCLEGDICYNTPDGNMCLSCSFYPVRDGSGITTVDNGNCGNSGGSGGGGGPEIPGGSGNGGGPGNGEGPGNGRGPGNSGGPGNNGGPGSSACIAIDSLSSFDTSELVFKDHRRASVLCDQHESCATPGHIVVYQSIPMSMSTYCAQKNISCSRRVKLVNSPRMKRGLRVLSNSKDLEFTALAAAKETRLEETVLTFAVSMGI